MQMLRLFAVMLLATLSLGSAVCGESRVNVLFRSGTSEVEEDRALVKSGASKIKRLAAHGIVTANASGAASLERLAQDANVEAVGADLLAVVISTDAPGASGGKGGGPTPPPPAQVVPTGVRRISAYPTDTNSSSLAVRVAIVDTGIDLTHPDLAGNIVGNFNAILNRKTGQDDNGHGSHVAGTVAALDNSIGVVGVAPHAKLLAVKVLNSAGSGYLSDISEGIDWAVANGAQVINMSLGYASAPSVDPIKLALEKAAIAAVVVVCAAGNSGPASNSVNYPAKYMESIAVSAWNDVDGTSADIDGAGADESLASFSSRGPEVYITAPGVNILSTWRGGGTKTISGTSMASPHVAGAVARLLQAGRTTATSREDLVATKEAVSGTLAEVGCGLVWVRAVPPPPPAP